MTPSESPRRAGASAIIAGSLGLTTTLVVAAAGFGLGSLVGAEVPLGIAGLIVGFVAGIAVVIVRFRDL